MLTVKGLKKSFGGVHAVRDCNFTVKEGSITALIGPNGAGKTTVFNLITGLLRPDAGDVRFKGEPLTDLQSHEIFHAGIARTFQLLRIFPKLSAIENLMIAQPGSEGMFDMFTKTKRIRDEEQTKHERAVEYLRVVGLEKKKDLKGGDLSYGQQKLLDIARCLSTEADLILLDEPVAGVNPTLREGIKKLLVNLKKQGKTILLIEHDMNFVMGMSDKVIVLDHGEEIAEGKPSAVKKNKKVIKAYLGE